MVMDNHKKRNCLITVATYFKRRYILHLPVGILKKCTFNRLWLRRCSRLKFLLTCIYCLPHVCLQSLMHFPCENYVSCGNIEGGNTELFFTKWGEAKKTNKVFPCLVPWYKYPLPFLVQMKLVASVIQSKSVASLDDFNVCLGAFIFYMNS